MLTMKICWPVTGYQENLARYIVQNRCAAVVVRPALVPGNLTRVMDCFSHSPQVVP